MKTLFRWIIRILTVGHYRMVDGAAEATEVGDCWLEDRGDGKPCLFVVDVAERDERGRLTIESTQLDPKGGIGTRLMGWGLLLTAAFAAQAGLLYLIVKYVFAAGGES